MQDWEEIWKKQFGVGETAIDFSGRVIKKEKFRDQDSKYGWDIFNIEGDQYIAVSNEIINKIPLKFDDSFYIDGKEFKFSKNKNDGSFELLFLENIEIEEDENDDLELIDETDFSIDIKQDSLADSANNLNSFSAKKLSELKENAKKKKMLESINIWEKIYGDKIMITDFTGTKIIKSEYNNGNKNSWKTDFYSKGDDIIYIASVSAIEQRNGRDSFEINGVHYNLIVQDGKYFFTNSNQSDHFLLSPDLLFKEIEKYFPSFTTKTKVPSVVAPSYSSLTIFFTEFPINELEKMRMMLQKLLIDIDVFQDIFVYAENNIWLEFKENCSIRIFFKSTSRKEDIKIFDISLIIKNAISFAINNIKVTYNLPSYVNFTAFLTNHRFNYDYISWFTNFNIEKNEERPHIMNSGQLIVDKIYHKLFLDIKGVKSDVYFIIIKTNSETIFYLCKLEVIGMTNNIKEEILKNRNRSLRD